MRGWDVAFTIILLLGMLVIGVWGAGLGLLSLAFMDSCPADGCDGSPVYVRWVGGLALGVVTLVAAVLLLAFRRRAWWVALVGAAGMFVLWAPFLVGTILYSWGVR